MKNNIFKSLSLAAVIFFVLLPGCQNNNSGDNETPRRTKIVKVQKDTTLIKKEFYGKIKESREVNLAFRVAGPLKEILVKPGDYIKKNDLIAIVDSRDYQVQEDVAKAQYEQVLAETNRVKELYNRKSVTRAEFEKALAGEKMVAAQLKHAQDQLNDTRLYAPFSGYIQKVNYENGELINTGMPVVTLLDMSSFEVETDIPSQVYAQKDLFVSFTCETGNINSDEIPLRLKSFNRKPGNNQLHKFYFTLNPSSEANLSPGMQVKVNIIFKTEGEFMFSIPLKAVFYRDNKTCVWLYHPEEGVVKCREVITGGLAGNGNIRIEKGLNGDELVVVAGVNSLKENQRVEILEEPSETNVGGLL